MKYCTILLSLGALAAASLNAGVLLVDGDFGTGPNTGTEVTAGNVNSGWVARGDITSSFNSNSTTNDVTQQYGSFLVNGDSGNPGSFLLASGTDQQSQANDGVTRGTTWQIFSLDTLGLNGNAAVVSLSLDVAVFTQFENNSVATNVNGAVNVNNAARVRISLYGFNGDIATSLASNSLDTINNRLQRPISGSYAGYTTLINYEALGAPSGTSDTFAQIWDTQTFNTSNIGNYDYYIFGISGLTNMQGVAIDNVSISAVPEPSTYIAGLGFIGLGYFVYRRRKNAAKSVAKKD